MDFFRGRGTYRISENPQVMTSKDTNGITFQQRGTSMPGKTREVSITEKVDAKVKNMAFQAKQKVKQLGKDGQRISRGEFKKVSPNTHNMFYSFVKDYLADHYGANPPQGYEIPIELMLDLPDKTRVRLHVDPKTRSFQVQFGRQW